MNVLDMTALAVMQVAPLPAPPASPAAWPYHGTGKIISTPDWSDYRIYPKAALRRDQEGRVAAEISVGTNGVPNACRITSSSKFAELDAGTCDLMMQMRFEPAVTADGKPVEALFAKRFAWLLTDARNLASSTLTAQLRMDSGIPLGCEITGGDGPYTLFWSMSACSFFRDADHWLGARKSENMRVSIEARLDAGDAAPFLQKPWSSGEVVAAEKISFIVKGEGDASSCTATEVRGLGPRGLNNLSPCERLLSALWFKKPKAGQPRGGVLEIRVIKIGAP